MTRVVLRVFCPEMPGEVLVCGNVPALADWNPSSAPRLVHVRHGWWEVELKLTESKAIEYKYLVHDQARKEYVWETIGNRSLQLFNTQGPEIVQDIWNCCTAAYRDDGASATQAIVMTYNIRYDTPSDGPNSWKHRKDMVARVIRTQEPHVVGLQEALFHQLKDLELALHDTYSWEGCGRDDGINAGEFSPIFYNHHLFEKLDSGTFWLSESPDTPGSRSWRTACTRMCTWIKLASKSTRAIMYVFNTHLDHESALAREKGLELLYCRIASMSCGYPAVLCGDFNIDESEPLINKITDPNDCAIFPMYMANAKAASHTTPQGPSKTFTAWNTPGICTIDYILVKPDITVKSYLVLDCKGDDGRFCSDHRPVQVELLI